MGGGRRPRGGHRRRPLAAQARGLRGGRLAPQGRGRPPVPPGGDLRHDRRRREPEAGQRRGHPPHGRARRGGRGRPRAHGQLDRRRRPLQGHLARGHVRGGREPRQPSLLPHQARLRGDRSDRVHAPVARLPAGNRRRALGDRRDGQDRRPLLLLQADPQASQRDPPVDSDDRRRGQGDQPRPGRLRGQGHGPHRPPRRARRQGIPPHRPEPEDRGRGDRHLRPRGARPTVLCAGPADRGRNPRAPAQGPRDAAAAEPGGRRRSVGLRNSAFGPHLRQLPDQLRQPAGPSGAQRQRHQGSAARGVRRQALGLLGASPRPRPVPRPHTGGGRPRQSRGRGRSDAGDRAADPRRGATARAAGARHGISRAGRSRTRCDGHRRVVRHRALGGVEDRRRRRHRPARRPDPGEARGDQGADLQGRRHAPTFIVAICRTWRTSTGWRTRSSTGTATWTS